MIVENIFDESGLRRLIAAYNNIAINCHPSWLPDVVHDQATLLESIPAGQLHHLNDWLIQRHAVPHLSTAMQQAINPVVFENSVTLQHIAVQMGLLALMRGIFLESSQTRIKHIKDTLGVSAYDWVLSQRRAIAPANWVAENWLLLQVPQTLNAQDVLRIGTYALYRLVWQGGQSVRSLLRLKLPRSWGQTNVGLAYPTGYSHLPDEVWVNFASSYLSRQSEEPAMMIQESVEMATHWLAQRDMSIAA